MWRIAKSYRGVTTLLVFLFVLLPFLNLSSAIDPDLNPKIIAVSFFLALSFFLFKRKQIELPSSFKSIGIVSILILGISAFSIASSINPGEAIAEWLRLFIVYSFFLFGVIVFNKNKIDWLLVVRFVSLSILIFSSFAVVQGIPLLKDALNHKRVIVSSELASTLSNKNFFSEVLLLLLPCAFYGLLNDAGKYKVLHALAFIFAGSFVFLLASTACWIAFLAAVCIVLLVSLTGNSKAILKNSRRSTIILFISIFILISSSIFIIKKTSVAGSLKLKVEMISKYMSDPSMLDKNVYANNNSVFDRILMLRNSLKMIGDHPFLGVGLNNWKLVYTSYGVMGTEVINSGAMNFEHPHNDYLLIFCEQGVIGIIFYLLFFVFVFKKWIKNWRNPACQNHSILLVVLFVLISFLVVSFFSYPRSRIYTPIILMFFISTLFSRIENEKTFAINRIWMLLTGLLCLLTTVIVGIRLDSEIHAKQLIYSKMKKNFARVMRESEKINTFFYPVDLTSTSIEWYKGMALFYSGQIPQALGEYQKGLLKTPYHIRTLNDIATAYEQQGLPDSAIACYKRALSISPFLTDARLNLSATYFNQNKIELAYLNLNFLKKQELGMGFDETYVNFMSAILAVKIRDSLNLCSDTLFISKMNTFVNNTRGIKNYIRTYNGRTIWPDVFEVAK